MGSEVFSTFRRWSGCFVRATSASASLIGLRKKDAKRRYLLEDETNHSTFSLSRSLGQHWVKLTDLDNFFQHFKKQMQTQSFFDQSSRCIVINWVLFFPTNDPLRICRTLREKIFERLLALSQTLHGYGSNSSSTKKHSGKDPS